MIFRWPVAYSETFQTSRMERFVEIVNDFYLLTIFGKLCILDILQGSEYVSADCSHLI